ncbi:hypothetical protein EV702DRAFT_1047085 [Suillus placidus]|uniref:Uncharacterized protein n=1 Tax=Suillus placidus TaxID=48579 RepID=A0A9P6ZR34_9AGAM|nr:hypothetical protein EV702DRAFT_1047085 [Suillus placidus]
MNTPDSSKKCPMSQIASRCEDMKIDVKRPKLERLDAEPMLLLPPFCQTPGPITVSQTYVRKLILERWEAEVKACPAISILQASVRRLVVERWDAELKRCEEAKRAQLLEVLLAAHVSAPTFTLALCEGASGRKTRKDQGNLHFLHFVREIPGTRIKPKPGYQGCVVWCPDQVVAWHPVTAPSLSLDQAIKKTWAYNEASHTRPG